jgi:uridine kinase
MMRSQLLQKIVNRIVRIDRPHPLRVAIDGVDAAGKTTLAEELVAPLEALGRPVIRVFCAWLRLAGRYTATRGLLSCQPYDLSVSA